MNIPKHIKVGGLKWTVEQNRDIATEGNVFGSTHIQTQKIFLNPENSPQLMGQTLIHELLHAIWYSQGLTKRFDGDTEEQIIDPLAKGINQVLKDNKFL
jgi:Zn-dependent peptidase ImmA (M78 family)